MNNAWVVTDESSIEKTFYDLPQGLRLTLYHSTLTKNQTLNILVNDISLLNITDKLYGDISLAIPGGNLKVKIIVNDNDNDGNVMRMMELDEMMMLDVMMMIMTMIILK